MRRVVGRRAWLPLSIAMQCLWTGSQVARADPSPVAAADDDAGAYSARGKALPLPDIHALGGAVERVDEQTMRAVQYSNPERVLITIPGVTMRSEDGYGQRPNIGIRGANSHRSRKITLLEDGVLQAYAPYSSPSNFSLVPMTRVVGIDVIKGPSAILYGPQTLAGAIDFRTRDVPYGTQAFSELSYGLRDWMQAHVFAGSGGDTYGIAIEGMETSVHGFQDIDFDRRSNGFNVGDYTLRGYWKPPGSKQFEQRLSVKLGYQHERSNETYLGLTDADFAADANRRYLAGAGDQFRRHSTVVELRDHLRLGADGELDIVAYRHDTKRVWHRLDRFRDGTSILNVLNDPDNEQWTPYLALLRADRDTTDPQRALIYVDNDWRYVSEGLQADFSHKTKGVVSQELRAGARLHYDSFDRYIHQSGMLVQNASLVHDGMGRTLQNDDLAQTLAVSGYLYDALSLGPVSFAPGVRIEQMNMRFTDTVANTKLSAHFAEVLPGAALSYVPSEALRVFAGVHRGFSPPLPQDAKRTDAETSINYELGARYRDTRGLALELAGFFSDYDNMTSTCTLTAGCTEIDRAFNAGRVYIGGLEAAAAYAVRAGQVTLPIRATYTFTQSSFRSTFASADPQLGNVERGDRVPYLPVHQASLLAGVVLDSGLALHVQGSYVAEMREEASRGDEGRRTDALWLLDLAASYKVAPRITLTARAENLLAQQPQVSRRPWGARPLAPFHAQLGLRLDI